MIEMLKEFYLKHEGTGEKVVVGYKVIDAESLKEMGYRLARLSEDDFIKSRKKGVVYIKKEMYDDQEDSAFLYDRKGMLIGTAYRIKKGGEGN